MTTHLLIPIVLVLACSGAAIFLPRFLVPSAGVVVLTVSVAVATLASLLLLLQIASAGISELPVVSDALGWCRALSGGDHGAPPVVGAVAVLVLVLSSVSTARFVRRLSRNHKHFADLDGVEVVHSDATVAFAVPGRHGGVVISDSLLDRLTGEERRVVLAHETAHLRHRHHLYVHFAEACAAGLPFLRPLARRIGYLTERWADEVAAERVGSRELVATTIARVALLPKPEVRPSVLAIGGGNVVGRFQALVHPPPAPNAHATVLACSLVTGAVLGLTLQLHHLIDFVTHAGHL